MPEIEITIASESDVDVILLNADEVISVDITEAETIEVNISQEGPQGVPGSSGAGGSGSGDMLKSVYDEDDDGIVDNASKLAGYTVNQLTLNGGYF